MATETSPTSNSPGTGPTPPGALRPVDYKEPSQDDPRCPLKKSSSFSLCPGGSAEEAERRMAGQPDGSFLIRDCSVAGDFTLTVRQNSCTRCVRIYKQKKGYSLTPAELETPFTSLVELVEFYGHHCLSSYNKRLNVRLLSAVTKPSAVTCNQYGVFKELYDLSQEQLSAQTRLSVLHQQHIQLDNNVKMFELMMPALKVVQQLYYNNMTQQVELGPLHTMESSPDDSDTKHQQSGNVKDSFKAFGEGHDKERADRKKHLSRDEEKSLIANTRLLMTRNEDMSNRIHSLRSHFDLDSVRLRELEAELKSVEVALLRMRRRYDELVRQMVDLGCTKEYLSQVLEPRVTTLEFDRSKWLVDCTRDEAVAQLKGLPHGAFLIRRKDKRHLPFVLSIVISSTDKEPQTVQNCYIVRPHGRGFGFNAALAVFETLDQLVLRHRYVSLKHYFNKLDVTLAFPVGCQELLRRSSELDKESVVAPPGVYANASAIKEAMEAEYEPVEFSDRGSDIAGAAEVKKSSKDHPYEAVTISKGSSGCAKSADVKDSPQHHLYEPVAMPERRVKRPNFTDLKVALEDHTYESVDSPDKRSEDTNTKNVRDSVGENLYEPVNFPGK